MTARILDCDQAAYFRDPCDVPSLTQSIARTLLTKSPAHAWMEHPRFGNKPKERRTWTDEGQIIHALLLGKGSEIVVIDADNYRTKEAQALKATAEVKGQVAVLKGKYADFVAAASQIACSLGEFGIELPGNGSSEVPLAWLEDGEEGPVQCRGMLDSLLLEDGVVYDVKKITSADPNTCARHAYEYGYDIQHAAYTSAVEKLRPDLAGRVDFMFLFVEIEPPYAVVPCRPDGTLKELGERRWKRAVQLWEKCLREDRWPAYTETITTLSAPLWALGQEEGL